MSFKFIGGKNRITILTSVGPCIVMHLYSKTNQMQNISNLFYFGTTLYMFRTVFPSITWSLRLYIQHHTIHVLWMLASKQPHNLYDVLRNNQQMQLYAVNFIPLLSSLYMFRAGHTPIIRSTMFNCIYSHWYKP